MIHSRECLLRREYLTPRGRETSECNTAGAFVQENTVHQQERSVAPKVRDEMIVPYLLEQCAPSHRLPRDSPGAERRDFGRPKTKSGQDCLAIGIGLGNVVTNG